MKTQIFKTYEDFLKREDKNLNGVSPEVAENYPNYEQDNINNTGCWNCYDLDGCSDLHDLLNCSKLRNSSDLHDCSDLHNSSGLHNCYELHNSSGLYNCYELHNSSELYNCYELHNSSGLHNCSGLHDSSQGKSIPEIPKIKNIHTRLLECVTQDKNNLDMSDWHTCDTTHCRAGWVVHLAGKEGYELEKETSTAFAAHQIYKKSSDIPVPYSRFYDNNDEAMKDIERCAKLELEGTGDK